MNVELGLVSQYIHMLSEKQYSLRMNLKELREAGASQKQQHPLRQALMRNRLGPYGLRSVNKAIAREYSEQIDTEIRLHQNQRGIRN